MKLERFNEIMGSLSEIFDKGEWKLCSGYDDGEIELRNDFIGVYTLYVDYFMYGCKLEIYVKYMCSYELCKTGEERMVYEKVEELLRGDENV